MIGTDLRRSIHASIDIQYIPVCVYVIKSSQEGSQTWIFIIRPGSFPWPGCSSLQIMIAVLICCKISDRCIKTRYFTLLHFGQSYKIHFMRIKSPIVVKKNITYIIFHFSLCTISLTMRPNSSGQILTTINHIIEVRSKSL